MPFPIDSIDPSKTALIVVDMQNDFIASGAPLETPAGRAMLPILQRTLAFCRERGIRVIYTAHVFRRDGCDLGRFADDTAGPLARHTGLVDGTPGIEIYPEIAPHADEIVIKKHRYSAFYGTDLDIVLPGCGIDAVVITGVTTENCCHATARDAFFRDYRVVFLSDATASNDYPDVGQGSLSATEVHRATLVILSRSTAHVMTAEEFMARTLLGTQLEAVEEGLTLSG
ncbi:MAG: cysteine hydrolase [Caldilineaceae bacterium]|nr:cysteine hydrolase [Caldilineaceae bacterium]